MDARPSHIEHARIVAKTISEFWEHSRVIQAVLSTADLDDFDDCVRALLRERVSLTEYGDALDYTIDVMRAERGGNNHA